MLWPQHPLHDPQGLLKKLHRLGSPLQGPVAYGQVVAALEGVGMLRSQHPLSNSQGLLIKLHRRLVPPQGLVANCQVVAADEGLEMRRSPSSLWQWSPSGSLLMYLNKV